jgi:predicted nucleic acid-binding protein
MFILDTNILSAMMSLRPSLEVATWVDGQPIFDESLEPAQIGRRNGHKSSRAHRADSHAPRKTGIPKGTQSLDLIH